VKEIGLKPEFRQEAQPEEKPRPPSGRQARLPAMQSRSTEAQLLPGWE
jgi:hypothetical protein